MPTRQYGQPDDPRKTGPDQGIKQYGQQLKGTPEPKPKDEDPSPGRTTVDKFHKNDDADVRAESHHHTLGPGETQASPGGHTHDGSDSKQILEGYTITGSKATPSTIMPSLLIALERLGAEDATTA